MNIIEMKKQFQNLSTDYKFYTIVRNNAPLDKGAIGIRLDEKGLPTEIVEQVAGTKYEGRPEAIRRLSVGDKVNLVREPNNPYNTNNIAVTDQQGRSLGNLGAHLCNALAPLMDLQEAEILETTVASVSIPDASDRRKALKLFVDIRLKIKDFALTKENSCILLLFGAEQGFCIGAKLFASKLGGTVTIRDSPQKLEIVKLNIPLEAMRQLFELYNRYWDEYNCTNTLYMGMDFLPEEMSAAREKMNREKDNSLDWSSPENGEELTHFIFRQVQDHPERYGALEPYLKHFEASIAFSHSDSIVTNFIKNNPYEIDTDIYYWVNEERVDMDKFDQFDSLSHWYEIAQLYGPDQELPFNLDDEDTISIFGFDQFDSMIDLSHGC